MGNVKAIRRSEWSPGDFRTVACFEASKVDVREIASRLGLEVEEYYEPGLGRAQWLGVESNSGWRALLLQHFVESSTHGIELVMDCSGGGPSREAYDEVIAWASIGSAATWQFQGGWQP